MDCFKLKVDAAIALGRAEESPRKMILLHSGLLAIATLALTLVDWLLSSQMTAAAGGLSGLDTQALLSTLRWVLQISQIVLTPFWAAGLTCWALLAVKGRSFRPADLLEGFRKWKSILSSGLMMGLQYLLRGFISLFLGSQLLIFTPLAIPLAKAASAMNENPDLDPAAALGDYYAPVMIDFFVVFSLVFLSTAAPVFYRYRLVNFLIMDENMGGTRAIFTSRLLMQRRRLELCKLDLSFWWYYLLELLTAAVMLGSLILTALGICLPVDETVLYWGGLILGAGLQLALHVWAKPKVWATYAAYYTQVRKAGPAEPKRPAPQAPPKNVPWSY